MRQGRTASLKRGFRRRNPDGIAPYLYLLPHAALFGVFTVYPIAFGIYVSLHRWNILSPTQRFAGLQFYVNLFVAGIQSQFFWRTLGNTALFVVIAVPLLVLCALGLALLLRRPGAGRGFFRTVFFMPTILSVAVMGQLWKWLFANQTGLINIVLSNAFGLTPLPFLTTVGWAWVPIIAGTVWWTVGFNMVLYAAALESLPVQYFEAADLDGAGAWRRFISITWPLLNPVTVFAATTTVVSSFQLFGQPYVITSGGPLRTTQSVIMYITEVGFGNFQFSAAMSMSIVFGLLLLGISALQFRGMVIDIGRGRA
jgi:multiple sugar transport system permease protein